MEGVSSALLIGRNGAGKSTIRKVLEIFQSIGRGTNRVGTLVGREDFSWGRSGVPMRFEIDAVIHDNPYKYELALELPDGFKELRVLEERLTASGNPIYSRNAAQVSLHAGYREKETQFLVDWHLIALPIIQEQSQDDPLSVFKTWFSHMVILAPIPSLISGDSRGESLLPDLDGANLGEWFSGLLGRYPAAYVQVDRYLRTVMPDIQDILNESAGRDFKTLVVRFVNEGAGFRVEFGDLSDGEKTFFLGALTIAANTCYGPLVCFWDEPDNYLSLSEVAHFVTSLRRSFQGKSQILVTSHNPEAINRFSRENTFLFDRKSHMEPTRCRLLGDLSIAGDLIDNMIRGDLES